MNNINKKECLVSISNKSNFLYYCVLTENNLDISFEIYKD